MTLVSSRVGGKLGDVSLVETGGRFTSNQPPPPQPQNSAAFTYNFSYGYDLAGDGRSETYLSGRTVTTSYDIARRPLTLNRAQSGSTITYVSAITYWPHGEPNSWTYGNGVVPVDIYSHWL